LAYSFSNLAKTQHLPSKFWQTIGDALSPFNFFYPSHRIFRYIHGALNVNKNKKIIAQFGCKL
jgi:hypothetical protein